MWLRRGWGLAAAAPSQRQLPYPTPFPVEFPSLREDADNAVAASGKRGGVRVNNRRSLLADDLVTLAESCLVLLRRRV